MTTDAKAKGDELEHEEGSHGLSRREMIKGTLKAGVYAAPLVLSSGRVAAAPAIAFGQDALLTNTGAGASFDVYYTLSTQLPGTLTLLGTIATDRFGFGGGVFPLTVDARAVTAVKLTYILSGNPPTSPPAATFTSALVAALAPVNGGRGPVRFVGLVVQEPTAAACQVGPLNQFVEYVDVAILNAPPNATYTIFVQTNQHTAPVVVTTATTNGQGNATLFAGVVTPTVVATPTSVVVTAVPTGGGATLTLTASGGTLTTIGCASLQIAAQANAAAAAQPLGITLP